MPADSVARAVLYAIQQSADVEIEESFCVPPRRTSDVAMNLQKENKL